MTAPSVDATAPEGAGQAGPTDAPPELTDGG
jgi:hypothetical protein